MGSKPKFLIQLLVLIFTLVLAACNGAEEKIFFKNVGDPDLFETDVQDPAPKNTVNIEISKSEENLINTLQANLLLQQHVPLFDYIDPNELVDFDQGGGTYLKPCSVSGEVSVDSSFAPGESIEEGSEIAVSFNDCVEEEVSYSGKLEYEYKTIESINNKFIAIDTEHCVAQASEKYEILDDDVIYFNADSLRIEPYGEETRIQIIDLVPTESSSEFDSSDTTSESSSSDTTNEPASDDSGSSDESGSSNESNGSDIVEVSEIKDSLVVTQKRPLILIKQPNEVNTEALTSMDGGDVVYLLENLELAEINCQLYSRELEVKVTNLLTKLSNVELSVDGDLTLYEVSRDLDSVKHVIRDSSFSLTVNEQQSERVFELSDYQSEFIDSLTKDGFDYSVTGTAQSDSYQYYDDDGFASGGDSIEIDTPTSLKGVNNSFPSSGEFQILGRGLERITVNVVSEGVAFFVDWDGEERIEGRSEADLVFTTDWSSLVDRSFVYSDYDDE